MSISTITYTDKQQLNANGSVADINKVKATDMNEIKNVVNTNANLQGDLTSLNTTDKTSIVSALNEVLGDIEIKYNNVLTPLSNLGVELINTSTTANDTSLNDKAISFSTTFSSTPYVLVSIRGTAGYIDKYGVSSITTTGCNLQYKHTTANTTVYYTILAIGKV